MPAKRAHIANGTTRGAPLTHKYDSRKVRPPNVNEKMRISSMSFFKASFLFTGPMCRTFMVAGLASVSSNRIVLQRGLFFIFTAFANLHRYGDVQWTLGI